MQCSPATIFASKRASVLSRQRLMNNRLPKCGVVVGVAALSIIISVLLSGRAPATELVCYRRPLTTVAQSCLQHILRTGHWRHSPEFHQEMLSVSVFAQLHLEAPSL